MDTIPESVALSQPILYIFVVYTVVVIGLFVGILRWIVEKFTNSLEKIASQYGGEIMEKLDNIEDKIDRRQPRRRGIAD